jgi:hypothetical protein
LLDHLLHSSGGEVQDKRRAIDLCGMRQIVWRENGEEFGDPMMNESVPADGTTKVRWCDTKTMLADGLTKHMDTTELRAVMSGHEITMEFTFHAKRKTDVKTDEHTCHACIQHLSTMNGGSSAATKKVRPCFVASCGAFPHW